MAKKEKAKKESGASHRLEYTQPQCRHSIAPDVTARTEKFFTNGNYARFPRASLTAGGKKKIQQPGHR